MNFSKKRNILMPEMYYFFIFARTEMRDVPHFGAFKVSNAACGTVPRNAGHLNRLKTRGNQ